MAIRNFLFLLSVYLHLRIFTREFQISLPQAKDNRDPPLLRVENLKDTILIYYSFKKKIAILNLIFDLFKVIEMYPAAVSVK